MKPLSILTLSILLLFASTGRAQQAQSYAIHGSLSDTLNRSGLPLASVVLIHLPDSILETYTRTGGDGAFTLRPTRPGKYVMQASFPSFADFTDLIEVKPDKHDMNLGMIPMISKTVLLKEVVITRQIAAIKIKGDTTEYVADSFKVKEGATVEDLLKKLPGIQVDKNGQVTAQGETVQKILVDGEEFFSDDPAVVTKGLQANVVNKVQVFDKKSDQAEFTGIDDGVKTKTINLELKEDKKKGFFGKVDAGAGTDGFFQEQGMINAFKGKRQLSAFGIASNTDKVGLGWEDKDKYSSGNGTTEVSDDGSVYTYFSGSNDEFSSWDGKYNGQGLPKIWTGGLHYADRWDEDKQHLSFNYRYAKQQIDLNSQTTTIYNLPGYQTSNMTNTSQFSKGERHAANGMYEWKLDSTSSLKLTFDAGYKHSQVLSIYHTNVDSVDQDGGDHPLNTTARSISSDATTQDINADLLYKKKFAKKGRTLSVDVKENYEDAKSNGFLNSTVAIVDPKDSTYSVNQNKVNKTSTLAFSAKANYTEPLAKEVFLILNYGVTINNSTAIHSSYNAMAPGTYSDIPDSIYSSNYTFNVFSQRGGANLKFNYKKVNFSFGSDISNAQYRQTDHFYDTTFRRSFFNVFPSANFKYKFTTQTSLSLNYWGSTKQPTIDQIQPLRQNTDPLNVEVGNTNLKQQFTNQVSLNYNNYKVMTGRYLWSGVNYTFINDAISTNENNVGGVRTYQYINVDGNYNGWAYFNYGFRIKDLDMQLGGRLNAGISHVNNFVNGVKATNDNNNYTFGINWNYDKKDKFSLSFEPSVTYNDNKSTINTYNTNYWTSTNELEAEVQLPLKFTVNTSLEWFIRQQTILFPDNNNVLRWNAYVGKKFLKNNQLELRASVFDILNQNIGFTRTAANGIVTQNQYNTISRYGMISLVWNFSKTPVASATENTDK